MIRQGDGAQANYRRSETLPMYLGELKKKRLIICLNEGSRKGRLYQITGLGKRVLEILNRE